MFVKELFICEYDINFVFVFKIQSNQLMSKSVLIKSSIAKKYWMASTGLFLCLFLLGHLLGNLQLLLPEHVAELQFNEYARFMTTNPIVKILSYVTYFSILFHAVDGIALTIQNKKARPVNYAYNKPSANSNWASRNMGLLGGILLFFLIVHMRSFWYEMHFGEMPLDENNNKNLYSITVAAFDQLWYVLLYVGSMVAIAFHLSHGLASAFQSFGVNHVKYNQFIKKLGFFLGVLIPLAFAIIPIALYLR